MLCPYTCLFALMLIISTIYFHCVVNKNKTVNQYRSQLPTNLQIIYDKISTERLRISYYGYALGLILSFIIIYLYFYLFDFIYFGFLEIKIESHDGWCFDFCSNYS